MSYDAALYTEYDRATFVQQCMEYWWNVITSTRLSSQWKDNNTASSEEHLTSASGDHDAECVCVCVCDNDNDNDNNNDNDNDKVFYYSDVDDKIIQ